MVEWLWIQVETSVADSLWTLSTPFICVAVWVVPYCRLPNAWRSGLIWWSGSHFGCHLKLNYLQCVSPLMQITSTALQQSLLYLSFLCRFLCWQCQPILETNRAIKSESEKSFLYSQQIIRTKFNASSPPNAVQLSSSQL